MNTVQKESLGHLNAQGLGAMGWYLQGQDPSGRVRGAESGRRGYNFPEVAEEGREGRGRGLTQGGQMCVIVPAAGTVSGRHGEWSSTIHSFFKLFSGLEGQVHCIELDVG